jgi:hypothetical protein
MSDSGRWRKRLDARLEGKPQDTSASKRKISKRSYINGHEGSESGNKTRDSETGNAVDNNMHGKRASELLTEIRNKKLNINDSKNPHEQSAHAGIAGGGKPSIVPDSAPRPHISFGNKHFDNQGKNLRAYVLGACFVWGIILGLLFQVTQEKSTIIDKDEKAAKAANVKKSPGAVNIGALLEGKKSGNKSKPSKTISSEKVATPIRNDEAGEIISDVERQLGSRSTEIGDEVSALNTSPLPKVRYGGLNGRNAPMPYFSSAGRVHGGTMLEPEFSSDAMVGPELE